MDKSRDKKPWGFCCTPEEKCTMNYCDDNGCLNRSRNPVTSEVVSFEGEEMNYSIKIRRKPYYKHTRRAK